MSYLYFMIDLTTAFTINYKGQELEVQPHKAGSATVFVVKFQDGTVPLVVTRAHGERKPVFWTSIPEGRQKEAEVIGPMITAHYQELTAVQ